MPIVREVGEGISSKYSFFREEEAPIFEIPDRFGFHACDALHKLRRDSLGIHVSAVFASVFRHGFLIVRGVRARTASLHGCKSARISIVPAALNYLGPGPLWLRSVSRTGPASDREPLAHTGKSPLTIAYPPWRKISIPVTENSRYPLLRKIFFSFLSFDLRWMNYIFYTYIEEFLVRRELERVGVRNRCISIGRRAVTKRFYTRRGFIDPFSRLTIARLKAKRITSHDRSYYRSTTTNDYALLFQDLLSLARNNAYIYIYA